METTYGSMKLEFCLQKVWGGWQSVRSPDNVEFVIKMPNGESVSMFASILDIVKLYDTVRAKEEGDMMIGTGNIVQTQVSDGEVVLTLDEEYSLKTTFGGLEHFLKQPLQGVFSELDGGPEKMPGYEQRAYPRIKEIYDSIPE